MTLYIHNLKHVVVVVYNDYCVLVVEKNSIVDMILLSLQYVNVNVNVNVND